ncbi:MAG: Ig-like domain-containing protein [Thermoplasmatota archaeon]
MRGNGTVLVLALVIALGALPALPMAEEPKGTETNTDSEPNDDFANATLVVPGAGNTITISGTHSASDPDDYYKIRLNRTGGSAERLVVQTSTVEGAPRLFVYDPLGKRVLLDGNATIDTVHSVETYAYSTGDYYVRYEVQTASATGYSITFTKTTVPYAGDSDNSPSEATPVPSLPAHFSDSAADPTDQGDWYSMELRSDVIEADVVTFLCTPSANLAVNVEIYSPTMEYLPDFFYEPSGPGDITAGQRREGSFGASTAGTWYLRVFAAEGSGTYTLDVYKTTVLKDSYDSAETAWGLPDVVGGHFIEFGDTLGKDVDTEDYFSFAVSEGQMVNATLVSLNYSRELDRPHIMMELRDSTNTRYGDAGGAAKNTTWASGVSPETTTASYLSVTMNNYWGGAGAYEFNITLNLPPRIREGTWEYEFRINESSFGVLDLGEIFYDSDEDPLTYTAENTIPSGKTVVDLDGARANFSTVQPGWTGMENYTVTATDPFGASASANVHVVVGVVNHPPYLQDPGHAETRVDLHPEEILLDALDLSDYFADDDIFNPAINDYLTFHVRGNGSVNVTFQLVPGTFRHSGGVTLQGPNLPELEEPITIEAAFWATDSFGLSSPELACDIVINPLPNKPPRWSTNFTQVEIEESQPQRPTEARLDLYDYCTDTDPWDRGALTFSASGYNQSALTVTLSGSVVTIAPREGLWTRHPHESITFNATDTRLESSECTVTIIINHIYTPPVFTSALPNATSAAVDEGSTISFGVAVRCDAKILAETPQVIRYRWYLDGAMLTATSDTYTYRADYNASEHSPYNLTVTFNDSVTEVSRSWMLTVNNVNRPPEGVAILSPANGTNFTSGRSVEFRAAVATDPDDPEAALEYEWRDSGVKIGSGLTFSTKKLSVGLHTIVLTVFDSEGGSTEASVTIRVKPAPKEPTPGMELAALCIALAVALPVSAFWRRRGPRAPPAS